MFLAQIAYHTLCSIAMELVGALESIVAGEQVSEIELRNWTYSLYFTNLGLSIIHIWNLFTPL